MDDEQSLLNEPEPEETAAEAFARLEESIAVMGGHLAVMARAVEHLTVEKQNMDMPDYSETLGEIRSHISALHRSVREWSRSPLLQLTPEAIAVQIDEAVHEFRQQDARIVRLASERMDKAIDAMGRLMRAHRSADEQRRQVRWAAIIAAGIAIMLATILPGMVARWLPQSWNVPERMAMRVLDEPSLWDSGVRLMRADDPDTVRVLIEVADILAENRVAITACRKARVSSNRTVKCTINLRE